MMRIFQFSIVLIVQVFIACTNPTKVHSNHENIVVTDFRGKEVKLDKPAERVVCLIESALSGIYMLKQQDLLVGVPSAVYTEKLYNYYSRLDSRITNKLLPAPGNWDFVSMEQIISLKPDLVIIWASQTDAIDNIEQFGIPVYAVMLHTFNDVYKEIEDFGILFNSAERAESLIAFTKNKLKDIQQLNAKKEAKSAYFMWAQGITETSGTKSTVNELFQTAGVENACRLEAEHISVSVEKIYDWNPDLIVMWYNEKLDPIDIINDPLLKGLKAIKERKVYELPDAFSCDFWTLKMQFPAQLIANFAYGEKSDVQSQSEQLLEMYLQLYANALISR